MPKCHCVMAQFGVSFLARWRGEEANVGKAFILYFFQASLDKRREGEEMEGKKKNKIMQQNFRLKLKLRFLP